MNFNRYRNIIISIPFFLTFLFIGPGCKRKVEENSYLRSVRITVPEKKGNAISIDYSGVIEEEKNVNASFMADGKIEKIYVKEGDRVRKGQLLASLDDTDYQVGVNQLKAQYRQMTQEKMRMDEMFARHNVAPNDYEKFTTGYEQLGLQLQMAENKLGYTRLYSSTDGYVSEKYMEPGELVGAGTPVVKITDDTRLIAAVDLPVNVYINRNNIKSAIGYVPVFPDIQIPMTIDSFTPDASDNMIYKMKLIVPSEYSKELTAGMNMRIELMYDDPGQEGCLVQARSVFEDNDKNYVWVYNTNDSTISRQQVFVTNIPEENKITVAGLTGNELIVETGVKQLYDGEKVSISNNSDFGL